MKILARKPEIVFHVIAAYCLISIVFRILRQPSLEADEAEQAFLSQYLLIGYGNQPPFYNWLQYLVSEAFGMSIATLSLVKNGLLFLCCLFYGLAARTILADRALSMIAMLGVLTLPPIFFLAQRDLSHTIAALFTVSLFLYAFLNTLKRPSLGWYLATGFAVGVGILSKYNFVIVPTAAVIAILPDTELRRRIFDWRVLAAIAVAALIVAPHAWWVLDNLGSATGDTINEMKEGAENVVLPLWLHGTLFLLLAILKGIAPPLAVFAIVFHRDLKVIARAESRWTRVMGRMILACFAIVAIITVAMSASAIREKWLALFIVLLPLYLAAKVEAAGVDTAPKLPRFLTIVAVLAVGSVLLLFIRVTVAGMIGQYSFAHTPYKAFAKTVVEEHGAIPASIITDDRVLAGNLKIQLPEADIYLPAFPPGETTVLPPDGSVLAAWEANKETRETLPGRIADVLGKSGIDPKTFDVRLIDVPYGNRRADDIYRFGYDWAR